MVIDEIVKISKEQKTLLLDEIYSSLRQASKRDFAGKARIIIDNYCQTQDEAIFVSYIIGSMEGAERATIIGIHLNNPNFTNKKSDEMIKELNKILDKRFRK